MNYERLQLICTEDGSKTVGFEDIEEHYHSMHGAVSESMHVYINAGLKEIVFRKPDKHIRLLEIGFGTGLNAYLSKLFAENNSVYLDYTTLEPFPLPESIYTSLNYPEIVKDIESKNFLKLHTCEWEKKVVFSPFFTFHKQNEKAEFFNYPKNYFDLVYFDAFAPRFQSELWTQNVFQKVYCSMKNNAVLTTYCCKGDVKRILQNVGFNIEKLPGFNGKREMLRGCRNFYGKDFER